MVKKKSRPAVLLVLALVGVAALVALNYAMMVALLRLGDGEDMFARLSQSAAPVETSLAFSIGGMKPDPDHVLVRRFSESVGLSAAERQGLPETHPLMIDMRWIMAASPYPPTLAELGAALPPHISFGYLGEDGGFHQVTLYGGEADTTPSILTPKARGDHTGHGDYFVRYIFRLRRPGSAVEPASLSSVDIMSVDWSTYRGGSYNGFEEIEFTIVATTIEVALLVLIILGVLWARRRRRLRMPA